jgi:hypothetical protein
VAPAPAEPAGTSTPVSLGSSPSFAHTLENYARDALSGVTAVAYAKETTSTSPFASASTSTALGQSIPDPSTCSVLGTVCHTLTFSDR